MVLSIKRLIEWLYFFSNSIILESIKKAAQMILDSPIAYQDWLLPALVYEITRLTYLPPAPSHCASERHALLLISQSALGRVIS
jgi:hypothetical protein